VELGNNEGLFVSLFNNYIGYYIHAGTDWLVDWVFNVYTKGQFVRERATGSGGYKYRQRYTMHKALYVAQLQCNI